MSTLASLTTDCLNKLYSTLEAEHPSQDTISGALTDVATSMSVTTSAMWRIDDYAEFDDGELVYCGADASAGTVNPIRRGQRGSTGAAHSSGDTITKNPPFPIVDVQKEITDAIAQELWPHVWTWYQGTITWVDGTHIYTLPANVEQVDLVYQVDSSTKEWRPMPPNMWDVERQIASTVVTNTVMLRIRSVWDSTATVYYTGRLRPTSDTAGLAAMDDSVAALIPWAVASRFTAMNPIPTNIDPAGNLRRDTGAALRSYRMLRNEFDYQRDQLRRVLLSDVRREPRFRQRQRRTW